MLVSVVQMLTEQLENAKHRLEWKTAIALLLRAVSRLKAARKAGGA